MRMYDLIQKKRDGHELSDEEIRFFITGYTAGTIPDYQASALCMAIFYRGMTERETVTLTDAMARSGDMVDLSRFGTLSADKHSTGGVGDKTSMIVAPTAAACGAKLAKMTGRGLGHTGGTVDKLESIPGYRIVLPEEEFISQVERIGIAVIGQSDRLTPADKKLYALRDVTATVDSIPLITSSIMSKKLAAGAHNIVLDVKVGSGAFMKKPEQAEVLAREMVSIGRQCGRNIAAVLTNMDVPLGTEVGNSLEVKEALKVLKGEEKNDLYEVCMTLAAALLHLVFGMSRAKAQKEAEDAVASGRAYEKMKEWIGAQGGDVSYLDHPEKFPEAAFSREVKAPRDTFIHGMDTEAIGIAAVMLGAGRASKEDEVDHAAGISIRKKTGDFVKAGETLAVLRTNRQESLDQAEAHYLSALSFGDEKPEDKPLIYQVITG